MQKRWKEAQFPPPVGLHRQAWRLKFSETGSGIAGSTPAKEEPMRPASKDHSTRSEVRLAASKLFVLEVDVPLQGLLKMQTPQGLWMSIRWEFLHVSRMYSASTMCDDQHLPSAALFFFVVGL